MPTASAPLIDASLAAFLQGGRSISIGAAGADRIPTLVRGTGFRLSPDRRRVTLFVSATQAAPVLKCIRDNGAIAVVFSDPPTHRTVQLKGNDAQVGGLNEGDLDLIARYREAFAHALQPLGFDKILIQTLLSFPSADIVSISFTPSQAYSQTPGPKAGERLETSQ